MEFGTMIRRFGQYSGPIFHFPDRPAEPFPRQQKTATEKNFRGSFDSQQV